MFAELKLGRVLQDAIVTQQGQIFCRVLETFFSRGFPEQTVIYLPVEILDVGRDLVKPLVIRVALLIQGDGVISFPSVSDCLIRALWNSYRILVRREDRVTLA